VGELNITFSGICTQLHNIVPGVPLRTVLPDASAIRFGIIRIPDSLDHFHNVSYYLMPHLAMVRDRVIGGRSHLLTGHYLRVVNARPQPLCRTAGGFSLTEFHPNARLAPDVVFEGNAAAYFDIFGGRVWSQGTGDEPRVTRVSIKTEGTPRISISPLPGTVMPVELETEVESCELYVTNLDLEPATEDSSFDFLMNYLVTKGGIPKQLSQRTPGMPSEPARLTMAHLGEKLKALGVLIETEGTVKGWRDAIRIGDEPEPQPGSSPVIRTGNLFNVDWEGIHHELSTIPIDPVAFNQSCSDSNYP